jgi:4'-phosphopantetheinyl transferase EntD
VIEAILPAGVASAEAFDDPPGAVLFPEEEALLTRAVDKRRREFTLGVAPAPILPGPKGAPQWPAAIVGSMTHCAGYRAAAVAPADHVASIGIDAEPHGPLPRGVLRTVALPGEAAWVGRLLIERPDVHWDRLLFCAKEAVYKAWFPLTGRWLGFDGADVAVDPGGDTFVARLTVPGPEVGGREVPSFSGRWVAADGLVAAAITVPAP